MIDFNLLFDFMCAIAFGWNIHEGFRDLKDNLQTIRTRYRGMSLREAYDAGYRAKPAFWHFLLATMALLAVFL